jgi:hypothetical protein
MSAITEERNHARRFIRLSNLGRPNQVSFSSNETYNHARAKFEVCFKLKQKEMEFYTECIFFNGCRADVFVLDTMTAIEVLETETLSECTNKTARYPDGIHIETAKMVDGKLEWKARI